ncbi:DUF6759 domain-containing protein [uncultured Chryseobacterium sp.]|uniref:DUF6759 domain-containing protein n=1 Tax=uncultured Chryseobacterium sp. TaxID=259322 RepID=UPI00262867DA|nr:DUF6759 domain-containing protein [uncultured Chryseobacterium sp.]
MNKFLCLVFVLFTFFACGQSKITAEQVEKTNDPKVVAGFIKANPDHPKTPEFKRKLYAMVMGDQPAVAKPEVKKLEPAALKKEIKQDVKAGKTDAKTQKTVDLLNHLFNSDPNSKEAYIQIENKSKCNLIVKISGKKFYNLDVPAKNKNFILVDKGTYTLTTSVCDAKYSSVKNMNKDLAIILNAPK